MMENSSEYIAAELKKIERNKDDNETAHSLEDKLHTWALMEIANGTKNPAEIASQVLASHDIIFTRWYA